MTVVRVPKTQPEAYDTNRAVSTLLVSQIERLQQVVREQIETEGQAAEYIEALTKRVWASNTQTVPKRLGDPSLARSAKRSTAGRKTRRKAQAPKRARKMAKVATKSAKRPVKAARRSTRPRKTRR